LLAAGIKILEWQGHHPYYAIEKQNKCVLEDGDWPGATIHTKAIMIDGEVTMIGSHNFNVRSEAYNTEIVALIADPTFTEQMLDIFSQDLDPTDGRVITCGQATVSRPKRVRQINPAKLKKLIEKHGFDIDFWSNFEIYM
jgi:phosphatidylserine/phosphatidylglycerophosphate/cardiolipin synthase-like enzyme